MEKYYLNLKNLAMKFRRIICNEEDFTSLKERISEKSNSDAYVNSISNHRIKIATNSKNTPFAVDILIVEDNINFIFKYFKAFHKIDPTLKVVACTKTNATKITGIENQIAALDDEYAVNVTESQPIIDGFDGLMARITALNELPWLPSFFIFLLFLAIETSPIIAKLLSPKGTYDLKLEEEESLVKTWVAQKVQQRKELLATDIALNKKIYTAIAEEEAVYQHKKKQAEALLKKQADAFHNIQIKNL